MKNFNLVRWNEFIVSWYNNNLKTGTCNLAIQFEGPFKHMAEQMLSTKVKRKITGDIVYLDVVTI